jgi:nitrate reductase gamma subunit
MESFIGLLAVAVALAGISAAIYGEVQSHRQAEKAKERVAEVEAQIAASPEKAKPAWDLARVTLEAYFNRNLSQVSLIFWLSVTVMVIGFGIVSWGVSQAFKDTSAVTPALIAGIAGVVTEFIGATFLLVYRSVAQQAGEYSKTLERINAVGMAMQILDTLPEGAKGDDLKNATKARLVEALLLQANGK